MFSEKLKFNHEFKDTNPDLNLNQSQHFPSMSHVTEPNENA